MSRSVNEKVFWLDVPDNIRCQAAPLRESTSVRWSLKNDAWQRRETETDRWKKLRMCSDATASIISAT